MGGEAPDVKRCWEGEHTATIELAIGSLRARLCDHCAEQKRELLERLLHGSKPLLTAKEGPR